MRAFFPPHPVGIALPCLLWAGLLWVGPVRADPPAAAAAATDAGILSTTADWQELVDGLQVRTTLPPTEADRKLAPATAGDWCQVQFRAFELAADGLTRIRLLDSAAFGEPPRHIVIGAGRERSALELGLIGLYPGEARVVRAPARHWPGASGAVWIEVQLLERKNGVEIKALHAPAPANALRSAKGDAVSFRWTLHVLDAHGDPGPAVLPSAQAACVLGDGTLVRGLDLGLRGMAAGESRILTIPAYLGYGERGAGGDLIPPGSTLWAVVDMLQVDRLEKTSHESRGQRP